MPPPPGFGRGFGSTHRPASSPEIKQRIREVAEKLKGISQLEEAAIGPALEPLLPKGDEVSNPELIHDTITGYLMWSPSLEDFAEEIEEVWRAALCFFDFPSCQEPAKKLLEVLRASPLFAKDIHTKLIMDEEAPLEARTRLMLQNMQRSNGVFPGLSSTSEELLQFAMDRAVGDPDAECPEFAAVCIQLLIQEAAMMDRRMLKKTTAKIVEAFEEAVECANELVLIGSLGLFTGETGGQGDAVVTKIARKLLDVVGDPSCSNLVFEKCSAAIPLLIAESPKLAQNASFLKNVVATFIGRMASELHDTESIWDDGPVLENQLVDLGVDPDRPGAALFATKTAADNLAEYSSPKVLLPVLMDAVADSSSGAWNDRAAAIVLLGYSAEHVRRPLLKLIDTPKFAALIEALCDITANDDEHPILRVQACVTMSEVCVSLSPRIHLKFGDRLFEALLSAIESDSVDRVRAEALRALNCCVNPRGVNESSSAPRSKDLAKIFRDTVIDKIMHVVYTLMNDENPLLASGAVLLGRDVLSETGALKRRDDDVRQYCRECIELLGGRFWDAAGLEPDCPAPPLGEFNATREPLTREDVVKHQRHREWLDCTYVDAIVVNSTPHLQEALCEADREDLWDPSLSSKYAQYLEKSAQRLMDLPATSSADWLMIMKDPLTEFLGRAFYGFLLIRGKQDEERRADERTTLEIGLKLLCWLAQGYKRVNTTFPPVEADALRKVYNSYTTMERTGWTVDTTPLSERESNTEEGENDNLRACVLDVLAKKDDYFGNHADLSAAIWPLLEYSIDAFRLLNHFLSEKLVGEDPFITVSLFEQAVETVSSTWSTHSLQVCSEAAGLLGSLAENATWPTDGFELILLLHAVGRIASMIETFGFDTEVLFGAADACTSLLTRYLDMKRECKIIASGEEMSQAEQTLDHLIAMNLLGVTANRLDECMANAAEFEGQGDDDAGDDGAEDEIGNMRQVLSDFSDVTSRLLQVIADPDRRKTRLQSVLQHVQDRCSEFDALGSESGEEVSLVTRQFFICALVEHHFSILMDEFPDMVADVTQEWLAELSAPTTPEVAQIAAFAVGKVAEGLAHKFPAGSPNVDMFVGGAVAALQTYFKTKENKRRAWRGTTDNAVATAVRVVQHFVDRIEEPKRLWKSMLSRMPFTFDEDEWELVQKLLGEMVEGNHAIFVGDEALKSATADAAARDFEGSDSDSGEE